jgi:hypothetical protein
MSAPGYNQRTDNSFNGQPPMQASYQQSLQQAQLQDPFDDIAISARCDDSTHSFGQVNGKPFWLDQQQCRNHLHTVKELIQRMRQYAFSIISQDPVHSKTSYTQRIRVQDDLLRDLYHILIRQQGYGPRENLCSSSKDVISPNDILDHLEAEMRMVLRARNVIDPQNLPPFEAQQQACKNQVFFYKVQAYRLAGLAVDGLWRIGGGRADLINGSTALSGFLSNLMATTERGQAKQVVGTSVALQYADEVKDVVAANLIREVYKQVAGDQTKVFPVMRQEIHNAKAYLQGARDHGDFPGDSLLLKALHHVYDIEHECENIEVPEQRLPCSGPSVPVFTAPVAPAPPQPYAAGKRRRANDQDDEIVQEPQRPRKTRHVEQDPTLPRNGGMPGVPSNNAPVAQRRRSSNHAARGQRQERPRPKATSGLVNATYQQSSMPPPPRPAPQAPRYQPAAIPNTNGVAPTVKVNAPAHAGNYPQHQASSRKITGLQQDESGLAYVNVSNPPRVSDQLHAMGLGLDNFTGVPSASTPTANAASATNGPQMQPVVVQPAGSQPLSPDALLGTKSALVVNKRRFEAFQQIGAGEQPSVSQAAPRPVKAPRARKSQPGADSIPQFSAQVSTAGPSMPVDPQLQSFPQAAVPPADSDNVTEQTKFRDSGCDTEYQPPPQDDNNEILLPNAGPEFSMMRPINDFDRAFEAQGLNQQQIQQQIQFQQPAQYLQDNQYLQDIHYQQNGQHQQGDQPQQNGQYQQEGQYQQDQPSNPPAPTVNTPAPAVPQVPEAPVFDNANSTGTEAEYETAVNQPDNGFSYTGFMEENTLFGPGPDGGDAQNQPEMMRDFEDVVDNTFAGFENDYPLFEGVPPLDINEQLWDEDDVAVGVDAQASTQAKGKQAGVEDVEGGL